MAEVLDSLPPGRAGAGAGPAAEEPRPPVGGRRAEEPWGPAGRRAEEERRAPAGVPGGPAHPEAPRRGGALATHQVGGGEVHREVEVEVEVVL